jgi:hypothetical protein
MDALEHPVERSDQIQHTHLAQRTLGVLVRQLGYSTKKGFLSQFPLMQRRCGVLELFVFNELSDQFPAGVLFFGFVFRLPVLLGRIVRGGNPLKKVAAGDAVTGQD